MTFTFEGSQEELLALLALVRTCTPPAPAVEFVIGPVREQSPPLTKES